MSSIRFGMAIVLCSLAVSGCALDMASSEQESWQLGQQQHGLAGDREDVGADKWYLCEEGRFCLTDGDCGHDGTCVLYDVVSGLCACPNHCGDGFCGIEEEPWCTADCSRSSGTDAYSGVDGEPDSNQAGEADEGAFVQSEGACFGVGVYVCVSIKDCLRRCEGWGECHTDGCCYCY